ncbi:Uncharacterised protein [Yersinia enterocolitica]|nr:Uncharacterised protein [Yersinia enterocolitica]
MTNISDSNLQGEDRQKSKTSVPVIRGTSLQGRGLTASLRSACSLRSGHFVNDLAGLVNLSLFF